MNAVACPSFSCSCKSKELLKRRLCRSRLESKQTLRVHVAINNAIRQISQWHYSFYIVMQQLFHRSLQTTTASQEEKSDE